jgi:hypothetical protein
MCMKTHRHHDTRGPFSQLVIRSQHGPISFSWSKKHSRLTVKIRFLICIEREKG